MNLKVWLLSSGLLKGSTETCGVIGVSIDKALSINLPYLTLGNDF